MPHDFNWSHLRFDWEEPAYRVGDHTTSPAFPWSTVDRIAIHYTGAVDVPDGDPDEMPWSTHVPAYIRAIQRDYVNRRGYSIGYSCLVTQDGDDWQLRGVDWRNAANEGWNTRTFTILVFVDGAEPVSPAAIQKIREIVAWFRSQSPFGDSVRIVGHRDIGATPCPGQGVYNQITSGVFEPRENIVVNKLTFEKKRVLDTRPFGQPTAAGGQVISLQAPTGALAVKVNITATHSAGRGYITAYPYGTPRPDTSDVNYIDSRAVANQIDVPVNAGKYSLYISYPTHVIADQVGYWTNEP